MAKRIVWRRTVELPVGPQMAPTESDYVYLQRQWRSAVGFISLTAPNPAPFPHGDPPMAGESEEQWLDRIALATQGVLGRPGKILEGCELVGYVDESELPTKPHFRGPPRKLLREAWRWDGTGLIVNLPAAREIKIAELQVRDKRIGQGDVNRVRGDLASLTTAEQIDQYQPN